MSEKDRTSDNYIYPNNLMNYKPPVEQSPVAPRVEVDAMRIVSNFADETVMKLEREIETVNALCAELDQSKQNEHQLLKEIAELQNSCTMKAHEIDELCKQKYALEVKVERYENGMIEYCYKCEMSDEACALCTIKQALSTIEG